MSQSGFTPIQLYRSATAATLPVAGNLAAGELAINTTDEKLYFENTGGTVTLLASSAAAGGTFTTVTATTVVNGLGAVGTPSYTFTGDLNTGMWSPAADTVAISTVGIERFRIDSNGNLLAGTTTSSGRFTIGDNSGGINGFSATQSIAGGYNFSSNATSNGGVYYHFIFQQSSVSVGSITSTGALTSYNTVSDYRLKDIDGPIANSGTYIDALKPVQGSWKVDGSRFIGLLAHEAQEVSETRIVTGEKDGEEMQAMDYSSSEIIANLIAEVQSLRARVTLLEVNL